MLRTLCFVILLSACSSAALADTTWVSDSLISGNWTAAHSPYMIQTDVHVPGGQSLNVGPGVTVFFTGHYSLSVDSLASFSAIGNTEDSVRFTTDTLAYPERWEGIVTHYALDTVRMEYCLVECAQCTTWASSTVCFHRTKVIVRHSTFRLTIGGAIRFFGGWIDLSDSYFTANLDWDGSSFDIYGPCPGHITNCLFEYNHSLNDGGAMDIGNGPLQDTVFVTGCTFRKNVAGARGGGFQNEGGLVIMTDCLFDGNRAGHGGAISGVASTTVVNQCTLLYNSSENEGGGIDIVDGGTPITVTECLIFGNVAATYGGGVSDIANNSLIERCVFDNNHALNGGAVSINRWYDSSPIIRNCTIVRNCARAEGSAISNDALGHPTLINDIFAFNGSGRAISHPPSGAPQLHNCDFFGNAGGNFYMGHDSIYYPLLVYADPLFVNLEAGDFHLAQHSPCVDAGWSNSPRDPDNTIADIGAFYHDQRLRTGHSTFSPYALALSLSSAPNPFNPTTEIRYDLPKSGAVTLKIFDLLGREVTTLMDKRAEAGTYTISWNAGSLPSGMYFAVLESGDKQLIQKLLLLK